MSYTQNSWSWFCWLVHRVVYHHQLYVRATGAHRERSTNEKLNCVSIQSQQHSHTRGTKQSCMIYAKKILIPKLDVLLSVASIQLQHFFFEKKQSGSTRGDSQSKPKREKIKEFTSLNMQRFPCRSDTVLISNVLYVQPHKESLSSSSHGCFGTTRYLFLWE